jgi:hypothetical protein
MGFDINICLEFQMCADLGRPYHFTYNKETHITEKVYALPNTHIPTHLRKYLVGRGNLFYTYTEFFNNQDIFKTDVGTFLQEYPSWDTILESEYYTDDYEGAWNEDDHTSFKDLLTFLTIQDEVYTILWSY